MALILESFASIQQRAMERKGGEAGLSALLSQPATEQELEAIGDDRYLAAFTKQIFQSGFVWRVIHNKWPNFEKAFWNFEPKKMVLLGPDHIERLMQDTGIVRNRKKIMTVPENAQMILNLAKEHGSFAKFIADWPSDNIIGLWAELKKRGSRLGGNTGPYALRSLGKDTFILSKDVEGYFRQHKLIDGGLTSKRSLNSIQECFNAWHEQSGLSLTEISQTIAFSVGDNRV